MSNKCPGCPFIQKCGEKAMVRQDYVGKIEASIGEFVAEEIEHGIRVDEIERNLPKNLFKRIAAQDDIAIEKARAYSVFEKARLYQEAQQRHKDDIGELVHMASEAPKSCSGPRPRLLGGLACTSELNTFKNRRKL